MTVREIQGYLAEAYGTEVGHDLISTVTDGVLAEVTAWQSRPLETVYPVPHSVGACQAYPNARRRASRIKCGGAEAARGPAASANADS